MYKTVIFRERVAFYFADVNSKKRFRLRLVNCVYPLFKGYALQFIIMKIVCEVDCLEDNEPIIYGPYAQRDCLDHNEFAGNEDGERTSERASERFAPFRMLLDAAGWYRRRCISASGIRE